MSAREKILDACDLETFLVCDTLEEGKKLGRALMSELGFRDIDIVYCEMGGPGVRVRLRGYINRPATSYSWQKSGGETGE
ncbi:MAG: hypothetical protein ACM3WU_08135 [Bacillota bacterium]